MIVPTVLYFLNPGTVRSQWVSDSTKNTPVCTASGIQQNPKACSDGNDGIIITWEDFRSNHWDVYAQKLDRYGNAQWTKDGVLVCNTTTAKNLPVIATDGNGGAYIVWKDQRRGGGMIDLYGQHVNSDGSLGYGSKGVAVDSVPNSPSSATSPNNAVICEDGSGGAYVMWEDNRSAISSNSRPDIYGNRLTSGGASWGKSGQAVISLSASQTTPRIVPDGSGGCYLAWVSSGLPSAILITRINAFGSSSWNGANGIAVYSGAKGTEDASRNPNLTRDGNQVMITWETKNSINTSKGWNVYAQRFKNDGTRAWGTATTAFEISTDYFGDQTNPSIFSDDSFMVSSGYAGVMVVFQSDVSKNSIVMTRGWGDGINYTPAAPNQMYTVCYQLDANGNSVDQYDPVAVKVGTGQVLAAWLDNRLSGSSTVTSIYAQRLDKTPKRFLGPSPATSSWGVPISNRTNSNADELVLIPRSNGAIAVWRDNRNGTNNQDIYAQVIFIDGSLPIELASFDLHPTADNRVLLQWETESERQNAGFEIERRRVDGTSDANSFEVVASYRSDAQLLGHGDASGASSYSYVDAPGAMGIYEYRLVDVTLDGERKMHEPKRIELSSVSQISNGIGQAVPNPFTTQTMLPLQLGAQSLVSVRISDVLGRVIATPYDNVPMSAGDHRLNISAEGLAGSGSYYVSVIVRDANTGGIVWTSPKAMTLQLVR
ncbi:MAG: hypothetical protein JSS75_14650 [Bacteroidetes bacterium]|nr:hypothetical protein [Bacteroidota bacterium]